jgi:hypothetical protein
MWGLGNSPFCFERMELWLSVKHRSTASPPKHRKAGSIQKKRGSAFFLFLKID